LTLATPGLANSLGNNKAIVVDGVVPTVSGVNSSTANGPYKAGDTISIQVNFSEAVTVTGTPQLTLETGATDRTVNLSSGSGTSALTFSYVVQAGDTSAGLDYLGIAALSANGGTIRDAAGNDASLTLSTPGSANSLGSNKAIVIDTAAPVVSGVTSSTANGTYKVGDTIAVQVNFSEAVTVTGTPQLTFETGATDRTLNLASGGGTSTLTFNYVVQAGDSSADLDYLGTSALSANGGAIKDAAGNDATLALATPGLANSLGNNKAIVIDGVAPVVSGVSSSTANGAYKAGDTITVQVNFSEAVTVTGTPQLTLETGATDRTLDLASGSGTSTLTFNYVVQAGDTSADLDYLSTSALAASGATLRDAAGNDAVLALPAPGAAGSLAGASSLVIDTTAPTVSGVSPVSADGLYKAGDVIDIDVTFDEAVTVTGSPRLLLEAGATDRSAVLSSGSGTNTLTFSYTVQAGDKASDLDYIASSALDLNGGTISDAAGNDAVPTLAAPGASGSLGAAGAIAVDGIAPVVTSVSSNAANGLYKAGDSITVEVTFSETVNVTGTPQLTLETGTADRVIGYASGGGTGTLSFTYVVQPGDSSADLDYKAIGALALNGGAIVDAAGNAAQLALPAPAASGSLGANRDIAVDGIAPVLQGASISGATLVLTYAENLLLDASHPPAAGLFTVLSDGPDLDVQGVAVDAAAHTVTLTLDRHVSRSLAITVSYNDPTPGDDANAIQDNAGNDAAGLSSVAVVNLTPRPAAPAPNHAGTGGAIVSSITPPGPGAVLTASTNSITDPDGLGAGVFHVQWLRDGQALTGQTGGSYTIGLADVGSLLSAQVSYVDARGHAETLALGPTARIADGDAILDWFEMRVPAPTPGGAQGDGNGDGVPDMYQAGVISGVLPGVEGNVALSLVAGSEGGKPGASHLATDIFTFGALFAQPDSAPTGAFMDCVVAFAALVGTAGTNEAFSFFVDRPQAVLWLMDAAGHWEATAQTTVRDGAHSRIDFAVEDGGRFDLDGLANGSILAAVSLTAPPPLLVDMGIVALAPDLPSGSFLL
ncbi:MAG: SwmB domain-containing protein, partial [Pseudomonadota bacterium]